MITKSSYALPPEYPFPDGLVWAAIRDGVVINMAYMAAPDNIPYSVYRQRTRGELATFGRVLSGEIKGGRFVPRADV